MSDNVYGGVELTDGEYQHVERDEIKGLPNIMDAADDWILYLNNFEEFEEYGASIPPGALFIGERGTGKTKTASYIASQADARFVNLDRLDEFDAGNRGADVDIEDVYNAARQFVAEEDESIILFQDEFDKAYDFSRRNPEGNENARQLLEELDGIEGADNSGIFYIGTANDIDDEVAVLRSGRLEGYQFYPPQSREVRQDLLDLFLNQKDGDFDVDTAALSYMFNDRDTPADIEATIEDSFFHAVKRARQSGEEPSLTTDDVYNELVRRKLKDRTDDGRSEEEARTTARHEIGHYAVAREHDITVPFVTVEPSIRSMGETHLVDTSSVTDMERARDLAAVAYGGYVAERMAGNTPFAGVSRDFEYVDRLAKRAAEVNEIDQLYESDGESAGTVDGGDLEYTREFVDALRTLDDPILEELGKFEVLEPLLDGRGSKKSFQAQFKVSALERAQDVIAEYEDCEVMEPLTETLLDEQTVFGKDLDQIAEP